ncbi:MAG: SCO family protein [Pseudomonadota bacterium]
MNETTTNQSVRYGRLKLLALLAIFVAPLVAATLMHRHYNSGGEFAVSVNGEIISPAYPLEDFSLNDATRNVVVDREWMLSKWTLVYFTGSTCDAVCEQNIYHMRQIHISLGKQSHRFQRLVSGSSLDDVRRFVGDDYPKLMLAAPLNGRLLGQVVEAEADLPEQPDSMYLVDPHGNVMMRFSAEQDPKGVLSDIKRALKASRIG